MTEIREPFLDELNDWWFQGVNIGEAIRKRLIPPDLPFYEDNDGVDEDGRQRLMRKYYCPDCQNIAYSGRYCQNCGRRLRE